MGRSGLQDALPGAGPVSVLCEDNTLGETPMVMEPVAEDDIRQYYDRVPYPTKPLAESHRDNVDILYMHNLQTAFYLRNRRIIDTRDKLILDAGCGSGYSTLALAEANPGALIVGIDFSEASVKVARERLHHHGFLNSQFYALKIEALSELGMAFDYINCDEVLYLLDDPLSALKALRSVLKPEGILRVNLHNVYQRAPIYRAQRAFQVMSAIGRSPEDAQHQLVSEMMESLHDEVYLKLQLWTPADGLNKSQEWISMNFLLHGDKGFNIPETFAMLRAAELEFISMLVWPMWSLGNLFKLPGNVPASVSQILKQSSLEQRLHLFELFCGSQRLIDFWCAHPGQEEAYKHVSQYDEADYAAARIRLHPQLHTERLKADLYACIAQGGEFELNRYLKVPCGGEIVVDSLIAGCLAPLWDSPQPLGALREHWVDQIVTHNSSVSREKATRDLSSFIIHAEKFLYFLIEPES